MRIWLGIGLTGVVILILAGYLWFTRKGEDASRPRDEIRVGGIFDLTGRTSEVVQRYAEGVESYIRYVNEQGGINGRHVRIFSHDDGYQVVKAKRLYRELVDKKKVCFVFCNGTGQTEELRHLAARDQIPLTSTSYSAVLGEVKESPYNFVVCNTYSDQLRILLNYIRLTWTDTSRSPRVALIYSDTAFGRSPIPAARAHAARYGIEIVTEEIVALNARACKPQMKSIRDHQADFALINETVHATAIILKEKHDLGMATRFMGIVWTLDDKLIHLAQGGAEGYIAVAPFVFWDETLPGCREIIRYADTHDVKREGNFACFVYGWVTAKVMLEGIRRAEDDIAGPGIRRGLEQIRNFDTGGITAPVSFSHSNHVSFDKARIGYVRDGRWCLAREEFISNQ